ncbi:MAG: preprotein translocase subunit SecG [Candidatus Omnitrophota bacterium]
MMGFIMFIHAIVCILLTVVILMQSGRGGGLTEGFSSAESMFGAQTNEFMIKATTILTVIFIVTCLSLAVLSTKSGKSLMPNKVAAPMAPEVPALPLSEDATKDLIERIPDKTPISQKQP